MKTIKLLTFTVLSLLSIQKTFAQKKIEGIGIFKIDKTNIKIIDSLAEEGYSKLTCTTSFDCSKYKVWGKNIYEKINDSINPKLFFPLLKENRTFVIGEYNVSGIKISALELKFYNDILYEITCSGDLELQTPLKEKYNGNLVVEKKEVLCKSVFGEFREEELKYTTTYRNDEKINAFSVLRVYYDDECKKNNMHYTIITNKKTKEIVRLKESEISNNILEKKKSIRQLELDKL